jgi:hypothetical protein
MDTLVLEVFLRTAIGTYFAAKRNRNQFKQLRMVDLHVFATASEGAGELPKAHGQ